MSSKRKQIVVGQFEKLTHYTEKLLMINLDYDPSKCRYHALNVS